MNCFSPKARRKISRAGFDFLAESIERLHTTILKHRRREIHVDPTSELSATVGHMFVVWQAHLHRCERLMVTCGAAVENDDPYALTVLARAFLESTALITSIFGYFRDYATGKIPYDQFDQAVTSALIGGKSASSEVQAVNILTHIRRADRFILSESILPSPVSLAEAYAELSEIAHPNGASNQASFEVTPPGTYTFHHGGPINERYTMILGVLNVAALVFQGASGAFEKYVTPRNEVHAEIIDLEERRNGKTADCAAPQ